MFGLKTKKKARRKLIDLDIEEVSLCDKVATGKRFYIIKKAEQSLADTLAEFLGDDADEILAKTKDEAEAMKAVQQAIKDLEPFMDVFDESQKKAVRTLAAFAAGSAASETPTDYGYPAKDESKDEGGDEKAKSKWSDADSLHFYKGGTTQLDLMLSGLMAVARENRRRANPREDDGFITKSDSSDDESDDDIEDHDHVEKGESQSLKGQDGDEEGDNEPDDKWASLQLPVFPRDRVVKGRVL